MPRVSSFPPIAGRSARVLILGTMPGEASLAAGQYYAHRHNAFWPILGELVGARPELPYRERAARLRRRGIALWDVLQRCVRAGSLDSAIEPASIVVNDFAAFFAAQPRIRAVLCNGGTAHACYRRFALPALAPGLRVLPLVRLPSTSPAHASLRPAQKLAAWGDALRQFLPEALDARER